MRLPERAVPATVLRRFFMPLLLAGAAEGIMGRLNRVRFGMG